MKFIKKTDQWFKIWKVYYSEKNMKLAVLEYNLINKS